jgi:hypothetical protein
VIFGVTWWNAPVKGSNWNIWFVVFPVLITVAIFTYSLYSMANRRSRLLSVLGILISGLAALLEYGAATFIIVVWFDK